MIHLPSQTFYYMVVVHRKTKKRQREPHVQESENLKSNPQLKDVAIIQEGVVDMETEGLIDKDDLNPDGSPKKEVLPLVIEYVGRKRAVFEVAEPLIGLQSLQHGYFQWNCGMAEPRVVTLHARPH